MKYLYYHQGIKKTIEFILTEEKTVLVIGRKTGSLLENIKCKSLVFVETDQELEKLNRKFDYIVLFGALGKSKDIMKLLGRIQKLVLPTSRVIIYQHNYLWQWPLVFAEKAKLKSREFTENWLSVGDVSSYLDASGFETTRVFRRTICPLFLLGIGTIVNRIFNIIPLIDFLKLDQYIIARPRADIFSEEEALKSLTICITVRNERDNIEGIVKSIPSVCKDQEILFVEGHSTDGTREEIFRVISKYPKKKVRVIGQPGKGQGDAIRVGFKEAKGDVIILYEGDGTSDPDDIFYFYEAMVSGRFEFIEGSRFVYPLDRDAMPLLNKIGNIFFAQWFSFVLGRRVTDVLSGIKAISKRDYELLYEKWGFLGLHDPFGDFELLYGAARMGLRFGEIPMRYSPRVYGESKSRVFTHGLYLLKMALKGYWIFRTS